MKAVLPWMVVIKIFLCFDEGEWDLSWPSRQSGIKSDGDHDHDEYGAYDCDGDDEYGEYGCDDDDGDEYDGGLTMIIYPGKSGWL